MFISQNWQTNTNVEHLVFVTDNFSVKQVINAELTVYSVGSESHFNDFRPAPIYGTVLQYQRFIFSFS